MKPIIVGIGELLWDMLPTGKQPGGAPANFAYHAQVLGGESRIVSAVGADALGKEIRERLKSLGLNGDSVSEDAIHPTGTTSVSIDAMGKPSYVIHEEVAWDYIRQSPDLLELARKADAVCFGTLAQRSEVSRSTIRAFLSKASSKAVRLFDVNLRQSFYSKEIIETSLELASVLKLSDEELPVIAGLLSIEGDTLTLMEKLGKRYNLRLIALTKGENGSLLYTEDRFFVHHGYRVEVVDTVGAGDAFAAALAIGILNGHDLDSVNDHANRLAAYVCSRAGATPEIPEALRHVSA
ncbi:MAG: carbohydrate kinase, partial [Chloroflexi bacterium]|nr:carbohydrate kinase [Chloroflexota bacterium]